MRTPLKPLPEPMRVELLRRKGLGPDLLPLNATEAERQAASNPGQVAEKGPQMPQLPPRVVAVAKLVALAGGALLPFLGAFTLPAWVPFAVFAVTSLAAFAAGLQAPSWFGRGVLPPGVAVAAGGLSAVLVDSAASMQGHGQGVALLVAALLAGAAGKALPQPKGKQG